MVDGGRVVAEGTPAELKGRLGAQRLDVTVADPVAFAAVGRVLGQRVLRADQDRLTLAVATDGSAPHIRALLDEIDPDRRTVRTFAVHSATLDDVFLALTGHAAGPVDRETAGV